MGVVRAVSLKLVYTWSPCKPPPYSPSLSPRWARQSTEAGAVAARAPFQWPWCDTPESARLALFRSCLHHYPDACTFTPEELVISALRLGHIFPSMPVPPGRPLSPGGARCSPVGSRERFYSARELLCLPACTFTPKRSCALTPRGVLPSNELELVQ